MSWQIDDEKRREEERNEMESYHISVAQFSSPITELSSNMALKQVSPVKQYISSLISGLSSSFSSSFSLSLSLGLGLGSQN